NYTIYSMENHQLERRLKITAAMRNHYSTGNSTLEDIPELDLDSGRIRCKTEAKLHAVFLTVVQASNPLEVQLLRPCLDFNTPCGSKISGAKCTSDTPGFCQDIFPSQQQGIVRCSYRGNSIEKEFFMGLDLLYYHTLSDILKEPEALISLRLEDGRDYLDHVEEPSEKVELYDRGHFTFRYYFLDFFLVPPIKWAITWKNGSEALFRPNALHTKEVLTEVVKLTHPQAESFTANVFKINVTIFIDMKSVHCKASLWNSSDYIESSLSFDVLPSEKPGRLHDIGETDMKIISPDFELACYWKKVIPKPVYTWKFKNKTLTAADDPCVKEWTKEESQSSHLSICNSKPKWNGAYDCIAENFLGMEFQQIRVTIAKEGQVGISPWIYLGIPSVLIAILITIIIVVFRAYVTQRDRLTELEIEAFVKGNEKALVGKKFGHEIAEYLPYNKDYEIQWKNFNTDNLELGRGAFGVVFKGQIGNQIVAAKTVLPDADKSTVLALLSELKIMIYLGKHEHLVELIGACTEFLREGDLITI
ncbi:unnamed protein product, partial [Allacma fusca]